MEKTTSNRVLLLSVIFIFSTVLIVCVFLFGRFSSQPTSLPKNSKHESLLPENLNNKPPLPSTSTSTSTPTPTPDLREAQNQLLKKGIVTSARSMGHTSVVLKVGLMDENQSGLAAFKPQLRLEPYRYRSEIAAYRLAQLLGIPNVQMAVPRTIKWQVLASKIGSRANDIERRLKISDDTIEGAMMLWVSQIKELPFQFKQGEIWQQWLFDSTTTIPAPSKTLAEDMSTLILFDYLTGNTDRWSGGNIVVGADTKRLVFVDNDAGFKLVSTDHLGLQTSAVKRLRKFPRSLVEKIRKLTIQDVISAVNSDTDLALLPPSAFGLFEQRLKQLIKFIDAAEKANPPAVYF